MNRTIQRFFLIFLLQYSLLAIADTGGSIQGIGVQVDLVQPFVLKENNDRNLMLAARLSEDTGAVAFLIVQYDPVSDIPAWLEKQQQEFKNPLIAADNVQLGGQSFQVWTVSEKNGGPVSVKFLLDASAGRSIIYGVVGTTEIPEIVNMQLDKLQFTVMPENFFAAREKARELFDQIRNTDDYKLAAELYLQLIEQCPQTKHAEEAYWRLSNLYMRAYSPAKQAEAAELLERYLDRYPGSRFLDEMFSSFSESGISEVENRLLYLYDELDRPQAAERIYRKIMPDPDSLNDHLQDRLLDRVAVLEQLGQNEEARRWLNAYLNKNPDEDNWLTRAARDKLAALEKQLPASPKQTQASGIPSNNAGLSSKPGKICLENGWCFKNGFPFGYKINALIPNVVAVGDKGVVLHNDDQGWTEDTWTDGQDLKAVWRSASGALYAVGSMIMLKYESDNWLQVDPGVEDFWEDISGIGDRLFVVGTDHFLHYDGSQWHDISPPERLLKKVSVVDETNVFVITINDAFRFDGKALHSLGLENTPLLHDILASSQSDIYVVGASGFFRHYDGRQWESIETPDGVTFERLLPLDDGAIRLISREGAIFEYRNQEFLEKSPALLQSVRTAATDDQGHVQLLLSGGGAAVLDEQGLRVTTPVFGRMIRLQDGSTLILGTLGEYAVFMKDGWQIRHTDTPDAFVDAWGMSPEDFYLIGIYASHQSRLWHVVKGNLHAVDTAEGHKPVLIWGNAADDLFVVDTNNTILKRNGSQWETLVEKFKGIPLRLKGNSDDNLWLLTKRTLYHYDGRRLQPVSFTTEDKRVRLKDMLVSGPGKVDLLSSEAVYRLRQNQWRKTAPFDEILETSLTVLPDDSLVVGGGVSELGSHGGVVLHLQKDKWIRYEGISRGDIHAVAWVPGSGLWAAGQSGLLAHLESERLSVESAPPPDEAEAHPIAPQTGEATASSNRTEEQIQTAASTAMSQGNFKQALQHLEALQQHTPTAQRQDLIERLKTYLEMQDEQKPAKR